MCMYIKYKYIYVDLLPFFAMCAILMEEIYFVKIKENILFVWTCAEDEQKEDAYATHGSFNETHGSFRHNRLRKCVLQVHG